METNYLWIGIIALTVIILMIWIIRRNQRDKKDFEAEAGRSELKPEKHEDERTSL